MASPRAQKNSVGLVTIAALPIRMTCTSAGTTGDTALRARTSAASHRYALYWVAAEPEASVSAKSGVNSLR